MKEVWRNVVGYEDYYEVSNFGRVKSLPRKTRQGMRGGRILKGVKGKNGYLKVALCKDGKKKYFLVHRLVGMAFADMVDWTEKAKGKPFEELQVNHKDQNKENNFVFVGEDGSADFSKSNLEWCDGPYNHDYGDAIERMAKTKSKPVDQKTKDGELIKIWPSVREIERQTGWSGGAISKCCNRKLKSAYGSLWSYSASASVPSSKSTSN